MIRLHRILIGFGIAAVAAGSVGAFAGTPTSVKADQIGFGTPTIVDPVHTYGEPNVGINPVDGSVYDSGPQGTGVQRSGWEASVDGGATFREVNQCPNTGQNTVLLPCGPNAAQDTTTPTGAPGGGDAEQKFDSHGVQYFADLYALACQRVAYTTDDGAHAFETPFGCGQTSPTCGNPTNFTPCPGEGSDRQWLAVVDPGLIGQTSVPNPANAPNGSHYSGPYPVVYMEYNNLQTVQNGCSDWFMIGNPGNPTTNLQYQPANNTLNGNFGCDGYPSVDQETGQVFEASTVNQSNGSCPCSIKLNIGTPDSTGFLHFLDDTGGPGLITVASNLPNDAANLFVVSSMDSAQNLHVSWSEDASSLTAAPPNADAWQEFTTVASAASGWTNWHAPVRVSTPGNVGIFPWVAAGDGPACETSNAARLACAGRSDTTWYNTTDGSEGPSSTNPGKQVWNVQMAQVVWPVDPNTGAYTGGDPISNTGAITVTPHPMQYGEICLLGTGCITANPPGNRNVADFFEVGVDRHGAAVIAYDDNSNNMLQPGAPSSEQAADHAGAGVITVARQTSGPGLIGPGPNQPGNDVPAPCASNCGWSLGSPSYETAAPVSGMSDGLNDALINPSAGTGGTEVNGLDLTGNQLSLDNSDTTLTVTMHVKSLSTTDLATAFTAGPFLSYVTRWLMPSAAGAGVCSLPLSTDCTMFYAMAEITPASSGGVVVQYAAGRAQTIDLCSVSACFPHVVYYSEGPPAGNVITCVSGCFDQTTGTISIPVPVGDVGNPTQSSLLEEVGSYSMASSHEQQTVTNAQAQADNVPFEVDGVCCFNFQANNLSANVPEAPWTPALLALGAALVGGGVALRRRRSHRPGTA